MEDALLRDDRADQEGDQNDDRHGLQADAVELIDERGEPQAPRRRQGARQRGGERADHRGVANRVRPRRDDPPPHRLELRPDPVGLIARRRGAAIGLAHLVEQAAELVGQSEHRRLALIPLAPHQPLEQPGAESVERADAAHVDLDAPRPGGRRFADQGGEVAGIVGGPRPGADDPQTVGAGIEGDKAFRVHGAAPMGGFAVYGRSAPERCSRQNPQYG